MIQPTDPVVAPPYYTATELIMVLGAVGMLLTGLLTSIANMVIAIRTGATIKENLKENTAISAATYTKVAVVEGHVNSERSKLDERIVSKERENETLKLELADRNQTAALLAQANVAVVRRRQPDPNAPHDRRAEDKAAAVQEKIEINTRETSEGIQELRDQ